MAMTIQRRIFGLACTLAVVSWLWSTSVDATTLAIIRTSDQIIIAADSLMTLYGQRPQLTCKIGRHGNVVFATAGLVSTSGGAIELHGTITNILRRGLPWDEQTRQVAEWIKEPLLRTLRRMAQHLPDQFQAQLQQSFTFHVSLASIIDGAPSLEMLEYFVEQEEDGSLDLRVERFSCPGACENATEVFGIGETEEMMAVVTRLRRLPDDVTSLARDLVTTEIAHRPNYVGPPVDVVRVSAAGIEWVALKPACRNDSTDAD